MSSRLVPGCAGCLENECAVHAVHEDVTPYENWTPSNPTYSKAKAERYAHHFMQGLNKDRKQGRIYTDGTLQAGNKTFAFHKSVVCPISDYVDRLFSLPMRERQQNVAKISCITPERLERLLEYVYTGYDGLTDENVIATLNDAVYFQIEGLKKSCFVFMNNIMNINNCLVFRAYAERYQAYRVIDHANQIISKNVVHVIRQEDFQQLGFDEAHEILHSYKDEIVEVELLACCENWFYHNSQKPNDNFASLLELVDFSYLSRSFIHERIDSQEVLDLHPQYNEKLREEIRNRTDEDADLHRQVFSENNIMVLGSEESWMVNIRSQEKYLLPQPVTDRQGASGVKDGQMVVVFGGGSNSVPRNQLENEGNPWRSVQVLDLSRRANWREFPRLITGRRYAACVAIRGNYYITGGEEWNGTILKTCECYYPRGDLWERHSTLIGRRCSHSMVVLDELLYVLGGFYGCPLSSVERYDESSENWVSRSPMLEARTDFSAVVFYKKIFVIGGSSNEYYSTVETYFEAADQWTRVQSLLVRRANLFAFVIHSKIFVFGGTSHPDGTVTNEVECYDSSSEMWSIKFRLEIPRRVFVLAV